MTQDEVYKMLLPLRKQERFYREYAQAAGQESKRQLLNKLDISTAAREHWVLPELCENIPRMEFADADFFDDSPRYHVRIAVHPRFEPVYPKAFDFFSILFVLQGTGKMGILGRQLTLRSGDFCLIAPGITHTLAVTDEDSLIFRIHLRKSTFQDLLSELLQSSNIISAFLFNTLYAGETTGYLLFHTADDAIMRQQILAMYAEQCCKDRYSNILINHSLILVLIRLVREYGETAQTSPAIHDSDKRFELLYYLMNNFLEITLSDVAEHYHFNTSYCSQYIKRITGKNFSELIKIFRIRKACELLDGSNMTIREISDLLGYANPESFILAFKKEMHLTPTQYRKGIKKPAEVP